MVTELTSIEKKVVALLELDHPLSLDVLGGVSELTEHCDDLAASPILPLIFDVIVNDFRILSSGDRFSAKALLLVLIEKSSHDVAFIDSIDTLITHAALFNDISEALTQIFIQKVQDRTTAELIRTASLEAALQWTSQSRRYQIRLIDCLLGIQIENESSNFLAHAVKVMGFAHAQWNEPALVDKIVEILSIDEAYPEAAFEYAMTFLHEGLNGKNSDSCHTSFRQSAQFFRQSLQASEANPQAKIYATSIELLCEFYQKNANIDISAYSEQLSIAIFEYEEWSNPQSSYFWNNERKKELYSWRKLADILGNTLTKISEPSWNEAAIVIETYILVAYSSSRNILSLDGESGLELLIRRQLEESLTKPGLIHHLEIWLNKNKTHPKYELTLSIFNKVQLLLNDGYGEKNDLVRLLLVDAVQYALSNITSKEKDILMSLLPIVQGSPDYNNSRIMVNALIVNIVKFVANRLDLTRGSDPGVAYLYSDYKGKVTENDLQMDLYKWLYGTCGSQLEISNIGGGRADISCTHGSDRTIIEVKKEDSDSSFHALSNKYVNQTISYQATSIRIGFLAVLDITSSPQQPSPHISNLFHAAKVRLDENSDDRLVIIFKIPGNRQYPSDFSRKQYRL